MGAVAVSVVKQDVVGNYRVVVADVTLSSNYATGGDTVSLGTLGLKEVDEVHVLSGTLAQSQQVPSKAYTPTSHGVQLVLAGTPTAPKLKAIAGAVGSPVEVANATNLSANPAVRVEFRGS